MITETVAQDLRVGLRVLVKEKSFCALAIIVVALGICGVATMFGVVNGIMLRGPSYPNGSRLMNVNFIDPTSRTFFGVNGQLSSMDFEELLPEQKSFEKLAPFLNSSTVNLTVDGSPRRYSGAYTGEEFLRILGVRPALGRDFTAADNTPGVEKVAIIGHNIWQRDFGGSPDVVGKRVRLNGKPATIIGVMPEGFSFPINEELWIPLYSEFPVRPRNDPDAIAPGVLGLLKPGVSVSEATAELTTFARRFAAAYPETNKLFNTGLVEPILKAVTSVPVRGLLLTMLAFCVGVLLIACVNVMNMQFARATLRARELAIRSSLGASRGRLIRQMFTESLIVAAAGAVLGVGLAYWATDMLSAAFRNLENPPPSWMTFGVDVRVLAVAVAAAIVAAVVSGLLPAWTASRASAIAVLREGGRGSRGRGVSLITRGLVVFQIVTTCILLVGSLLQARSILKQQTLDYGYDTAGILSARLGLMEGDYPSQESRRLFYDHLVRELANVPDFQNVALTNRMRMVNSGTARVEIEGRQYRDKRDRANTNFEQVSGHYFEVIGRRLLEGRTFAEDDLDSRLPVAIVNAAFAKKHFGTASAVGRHFRTVDDAAKQIGPWRTIVGVAPTLRMVGPFNNPDVDDAGFYLPFYSSVVGPALPEPFASQFATVIVRPRSGLRAETLIPALSRAVAKVDPNLPLYFVGTPAKNIDGVVATFRIIAILFTIFGLVAVVLSGAGIYGVMAFSVSQRTQEFGVRMALGAARSRILGMLLTQGSRQVGLGLALGLVLSYGLATVGRDAIGNMLVGVSARDPLTFGTVVALVTVVSLFATLVPARRATRVDPVVALRAE